MEVIGAVTALIALATETAKIGRDIRECYNTMVQARKDVRFMASEMLLFSQTVAQFYELIKQMLKMEKSNCRISELSALAETVLDQATLVKEDTLRILDCVRALRDGDESTPIKQKLAHVRWYFEKKDLQAILLEISLVKQSMALIYTGLIFREKMREWNEQVEKNTTISDELRREVKHYKIQLRQQIQARKHVEQELLELKAEAPHLELAPLQQDFKQAVRLVVREEMVSERQLRKSRRSVATSSVTTNTSTTGRYANQRRARMFASDVASSPPALVVERHPLATRSTFRQQPSTPAVPTPAPEPGLPPPPPVSLQVTHEPIPPRQDSNLEVVKPDRPRQMGVRVDGLGPLKPERLPSSPWTGRDQDDAVEDVVYMDAQDNVRDIRRPRRRLYEPDSDHYGESFSAGSDLSDSVSLGRGISVSDDSSAGPRLL